LFSSCEFHDHCAFFSVSRLQELRSRGERHRETQSEYLKLSLAAENRIAKRDLARRIANDANTKSVRFIVWVPFFSPRLHIIDASTGFITIDFCALSHFDPFYPRRSWIPPLSTSPLLLAFTRNIRIGIFSRQ
jgi:hypothetical protein